VAVIAGAQLDTALRLGFGMLGVQFAIGAINDLADATADGLAMPTKPIPGGLVSKRAAVFVALSASAMGLAMAASVGAAALIVGIVGLADGLVYDLRLKRTPLAWLPFAVEWGCCLSTHGGAHVELCRPPCFPSLLSPSARAPVWLSQTPTSISRAIGIQEFRLWRPRWGLDGPYCSMRRS